MDPAPNAPLPPQGTLEAPLGGPHFAHRTPNFLLGIRCPGGHTLLVYASAFDAPDPLTCPHCQTQLR